MAKLKAGLDGSPQPENVRRLNELEALFTAINKSQGVEMGVDGNGAYAAWRGKLR